MNFYIFGVYLHKYKDKIKSDFGVDIKDLGVHSLQKEAVSKISL